MDYQITIRKTSGKKLYIDPLEEEGFYLYPGEVKRRGWKDGMLISQEEFERTRAEYAVPRAKKRALGLLSKKDMTESQLLTKLESSMNDSYSIAQTMAFVTSHHYINDEDYARDYIYFRKGRKSHRQMREELIQKGISREILDRVFEEEGDQSLDEIRPLVEKYARKFPELDYKNIQKICMHFARKGYDLSSVRQIIEEIMDKDLQGFEE